MRTLITLTLSGSALALVLSLLNVILGRKISKTVYYYAWLLVLLRFLLRKRRKRTLAGHEQSITEPTES